VGAALAREETKMKTGETNEKVGSWEAEKNWSVKFKNCSKESTIQLTRKQKRDCRRSPIGGGDVFTSKKQKGGGSVRSRRPAKGVGTFGGTSRRNKEQHGNEENSLAERNRYRRRGIGKDQTCGKNPNEKQRQ